MYRVFFSLLVIFTFVTSSVAKEDLQDSDSPSLSVYCHMTFSGTCTLFHRKLITMPANLAAVIFHDEYVNIWDSSNKFFYSKMNAYMVLHIDWGGIVYVIISNNRKNYISVNCRAGPGYVVSYAVERYQRPDPTFSYEYTVVGDESGFVLLDHGPRAQMMVCKATPKE